MKNFSVGQRVRYKEKDNYYVKKGYETTVISFHKEDTPNPSIKFKDIHGTEHFSYARCWEPVDEKPSEDLFQ